MALRRRPPPPWAVVLFGLLVLFFGAMLVRDIAATPPPLASMQPQPIVLLAPVRLEKPSGRGGPGPYGDLTWSGNHARVMYLCFLADCALPPGVKTLQAGDHIEAWVDGGVAWQLGTATSAVLSYDDTVRAFHDAKMRRIEVLLPIWLLTLVLAIAAWRLRRRRA